MFKIKGKLSHKDEEGSPPPILSIKSVSSELVVGG